MEAPPHRGSPDASGSSHAKSTSFDNELSGESVGEDFGASVAAEVAKGGASAIMQLKFRLRHRFDRCPDAEGTVPGDGRFQVRMGMTGQRRGSAKLQATFDPRFTFDLTGHVGDDGKLHSYDVRMHGTEYIASGKLEHGVLVTTEEPQLWVLDASLEGLPPNAPELIGKTALGKLGHFKLERAVAPSSGTVKTAQQFGELGIAALAIGVMTAGEDLKKAEAGWNGDRPCVKVEPQEEITVRAGQSASGALTVSGPPKKGTAPGTFTTSVELGSVVPAQGAFAPGKPVEVTYTAPATLLHDEYQQVHLHTVSRQGRAEGHVVVHILAAPYKLVFTHTTAGEDAYHYDNSFPPYVVDYGDFQEHRDVQVSATVPLKQEEFGEGFEGSGPVRWTRSSWSYEDDKVSSDNGGGTCELDNQEALSGEAGGTLAVSELELGDAPSADVVLSGLGETWHQHDVSGSGGSDECPGLDRDYQRSYLMTEIDLAHDERGDVRSTESDESGLLTSIGLHLDSGWHPGTGNVVATRTISGASPYTLGPGAEATAMTYTDTFRVVREAG